VAALAQPRHGLDRVALWIGTALGSGYFPYAPGTCGTFMAVPLCLALQPAGPVAYLAVTIGLLLAGVWASDRIIALTGGKDPQIVVVDEVIGFLITMALIEPTLISVTLGFILFRVFDITKPNLVKRMEGLAGGWGVMMDDFMAGLYAHMSLRALLWIFEPP
jgi:phosphatidylglycerophosphatase A